MDSNEEKIENNRGKIEPAANKGASSSLPGAESEKTNKAQRPPKTAAELAMAGVDTGESSVRESAPEENEVALEKETADEGQSDVLPEPGNSEKEAYSWEHFAEYEYEEEYRQPAKAAVHMAAPQDDADDEFPDEAGFTGKAEELDLLNVETAEIQTDLSPDESKDTGEAKSASREKEEKASSPDTSSEDPSDGLLSIEEFERQGKEPEKTAEKTLDEDIHRQQRASGAKGEKLDHTSLNKASSPAMGPSTNDYINRILSELDGKAAKVPADMETVGPDIHTTKRIFRAKGREPDGAETSAYDNVLSLEGSHDGPEKPVASADKTTSGPGAEEAQSVDTHVSKRVFRAKGREPDSADPTDEDASDERLSMDEPESKTKSPAFVKAAPHIEDKKPDSTRGFLPEEKQDQDPGKKAVASTIAEFHAQAGLLEKDAGQASSPAGPQTAKSAPKTKPLDEDGDIEDSETIEQKIPPGKYVYTAKGTKGTQPQTEKPPEREERPEARELRETQASEPTPVPHKKVDREEQKEPTGQEAAASEPQPVPLEASEREKAQEKPPPQKSITPEPSPVLKERKPEEAQSKPPQQETQIPESQPAASKFTKREGPTEKPRPGKEEASEPAPASSKGTEREEAQEKPSQRKSQGPEVSPAQPKVQDKDLTPERPSPKKVQTSEPSPAPSKVQEGQDAPKETVSKKTKATESSTAPSNAQEQKASSEKLSPKKAKVTDSSTVSSKAGRQEASAEKPSPKKIKIMKAPSASVKAQESAAEPQKVSVKKLKANQSASSKAAKTEESQLKDPASKQPDSQPSSAPPKPLKPPPPPQTASRPFSFLKKTETLTLDEENERPKQKRNIHEYGRMSIALFGVCIGVAFLILFMGSWMMVALNIKPSNPVMDTGYDDPLIDIHEIPLDNEGLPTTEIIAMAAPSVVSLVTYGSNNQEPLGNGSGIILTEDGFIATNAHVIGDAQTVRVTLDSGDAFTAEIMGKDEQNDIALLKINATGLVPAEFANPDSLRRGQRVIAIGNAAGMLPGTPSLGIISGVNRELSLPLEDDLEVEMPLIQTDAAINPGSSGGALVNIHGQVVGMIVAKLPDAEIDNIGFAIPANIVQASVEGMQQYGDVSPAPELGITVMSLNETNTPDTDMPTEGLLISGLAGGSELEKQGVSVWDILLEADGMPLLTQADLATALSSHQPGDSVLLRVYFAQTGEERDITVPLIG